LAGAEDHPTPANGSGRKEAARSKGQGLLGLAEALHPAEADRGREQGQTDRNSNRENRAQLSREGREVQNVGEHVSPPLAQ